MREKCRHRFRMFFGCYLGLLNVASSQSDLPNQLSF